MGLTFMGVNIHGFSGDVFSLYDSRFESNPLCCGNPESMEYHSSWNWLMPVAKKCYKRQVELKEGLGFFNDISIFSEIDEVYFACIDFIKWYNKKLNHKKK